MIDFIDAKTFLEKIESDLKMLGICLDDFYIDHICFRVKSAKRYEELKASMLSVHTLLHEAVIGNRLISSFLLSCPIEYKHHRIPLLELPAPKEDTNYEEGFEHIECVIKESFVDFSNNYPDIEFDWKGAQKKHNPELRIKLGSLSVKFHQESLQDVITKELNLLVKI